MPKVILHYSAIASGNNLNASKHNILIIYEKSAAIIWFVIAALQIIGGLFTYYTPVIVGCRNIYTGVQRIKHSKALADMPSGI